MAAVEAQECARHAWADGARECDQLLAELELNSCHQSQHAEKSGADEQSDSYTLASSDDPLKAICPEDVFHDGAFASTSEEERANRAAIVARQRFYALCEEWNVPIDAGVKELLDDASTKSEVIFFLLVLLSRNLRAKQEQRKKRAVCASKRELGELRQERLLTINVEGVDRAVVDSVFADIELLLEYWHAPIPRIFYDRTPDSESGADLVLAARSTIENVMEYWEKQLRSGSRIVAVHLKHLLSDLCSILDYLSKLVMMASVEYQSADDQRKRELLIGTGYNNMFIAQLEAAGADVSDLIAHQSLFVQLKRPRNYTTHHGLNLLTDGSVVKDPLYDDMRQDMLHSPANITGAVEKVCAIVQRCRQLFR